MTEAMDPARFETLVSAYGATSNRWPEEERDAALAFARTDPRAGALLADADGIDALLFAHRVAEPSRTLRAMVIEGAPRRRSVIRQTRLWWAGLLFALAAGGGAVAGSAATAVLDPADANVQMYEHDDLLAYDTISEESAR